MPRNQRATALLQATLPQSGSLSAAKRTAKATANPVLASAAEPVAALGGPTISGLAEFISVNRRIKGLLALKEELAANLRPLMYQAHQDEVARLKVIDAKKLVKTLTAQDGSATAGLQLREKRSDCIPDELIRLFTAAKLPLRFVPSRTIVNPKYAGMADKKDDPAQLSRTIAALTKLIAENPGLGIPADFLAETEPETLADDGTLLKALRLPAKLARTILPLVADVVVTKGVIDDELYAKLMNPKTEKRADEKATILDAERAERGDTEEYPSTRGSSKRPKLRLVKD